MTQGKGYNHNGTTTRRKARIILFLPLCRSAVVVKHLDRWNREKEGK